MIYDINGEHVDGDSKDIYIRKSRPPVNPPLRIGTALASLIPDWAVKDKDGCGCKSWARKMDDWGENGVIKNREAIITRLVGQRHKLIPVLQLVPEPLARIAAGKLLDQAIAKAKNSSRV